mmetsp:Transcript_19529/g.31425  ORF Transcript_19529/g.31425 Transcript_19529/m.31425 type:complete len:261 (-) Transcript_19529:519-1301(-)
MPEWFPGGCFPAFRFQRKHEYQRRQWLYSFDCCLRTPAPGDWVAAYEKRRRCECPGQRRAHGSAQRLHQGPLAHCLRPGGGRRGHRRPRRDGLCARARRLPAGQGRRGGLPAGEGGPRRRGGPGGLEREHGPAPGGLEGPRAGGVVVPAARGRRRRAARRRWRRRPTTRGPSTPTPGETPAGTPRSNRSWRRRRWACGTSRRRAPGGRTCCAGASRPRWTGWAWRCPRGGAWWTWAAAPAPAPASSPSGTRRRRRWWAWT